MDRKRLGPRYVYISNVLKQTVSDAAIISWLQMFEKKGIAFDVVLTTWLPDYVRKRKLYRTKIKEAQTKVSGSFYQIPMMFGLGQLTLFVLLFFLLFTDMRLQRLIVIKTRIPHLTAVRLLKWVYSRVHIVFDSRGATAEEFMLRVRYQRARNPIIRTLFKSKPVVKFLYDAKISRSIRFAFFADTVLCVSAKLKDYWLGKNTALARNKFIVIPGAADSAQFFWDAEAREKIREQHCLKGKFVFVYSGALAKPWQIPHFVFDVFSRLLSRNPGLFLLCLTPDTAIAGKYMRRFHLSDDHVWTGYVQYDDINGYLCAADAGLLLREDTLTNRVASPTKFAEYLMAGLPILISEKVGDFSDFVNAHQTGFVVNNTSESLIADIEGHLLKQPFDRNTIAQIGRRYFSKEQNLHKFLGIFQKVRKDKKRVAWYGKHDFDRSIAD